MATIKQEVNWLPCNFKHVNLVFWGSVILGIIAAIFLGWFTQTLNTTFMWIGKCFGLGGAICGAIFTYVFAKGCRSVKSSLYTVFLLMAVTSLLQVIISFPITITNPDPTILIINSLLGLIALVLYIVATVIICSNCTGELGNIGRNMWKVPLIFIGIIVISVLAGLVINDNASESLIIVLGAVGGIWIIYAIFAKILLPMKDLLIEGQLVEELTQNGVDVYSDDERTQIAEMEGYQASEATVYDQPQMTQQKAKGGLGEVWNRLSGTMQGIIVAIIVVLLALAGFGIYSAVKSSGDSHDTYDEDEDFDRIELASPSDEEEVAVEEVVDEAPLEDYDSYSNTEGNSLPDWVSNSIINAFGMRGFSMREDKRSYFRYTQIGGDEMGRYEGTVGGYPIIWEMKINYDGIVSGKYAFKSTLNKYGDKPKNWFKLKGNLIFDSDGIPYIIVRDFNPKDDTVFEYFLLENNGYDDSWSGRMMNKIHLDNPNGHFYDVEIELAE